MQMAHPINESSASKCVLLSKKQGLNIFSPKQRWYISGMQRVSSFHWAFVKNNFGIPAQTSPLRTKNLRSWIPLGYIFEKMSLTTCSSLPTFSHCSLSCSDVAYAKSLNSSMVSLRGFKPFMRYNFWPGAYCCRSANSTCSRPKIFFFQFYAFIFYFRLVSDNLFSISDKTRAIGNMNPNSSATPSTSAIGSNPSRGNYGPSLFDSDWANSPPPLPSPPTTTSPRQPNTTGATHGDKPESPESIDVKPDIS